MNPELPAPNIRPESQPAPGYGETQTPDVEYVGEKTHENEQAVQRGEVAPAPPPQVLPLPPMPVPVPVPAAPVADDTTAGPTIAADDDLIEKEWVDKAKKIIADTRNDPYKREQEVAKLQADYLRKRYGKELGVSD